jgi:hypothetical protein
MILPLASMARQFRRKHDKRGNAVQSASPASQRKGGGEPGCPRELQGDQTSRDSNERTAVKSREIGSTSLIVAITAVAIPARACDDGPSQSISGFYKTGK